MSIEQQRYGWIISRGLAYH